MDQFDHEKLDVYQIAIDWVSLAQDIAEALPGKGKGTLTDQLQRAASSIPLNIAEGAGEFSGAEKARFYRMAKRSVTECRSPRRGEAPFVDYSAALRRRSLVAAAHCQHAHQARSLP